MADTGLELDLGPLISLLRVEPDTLAALSAKVNNFPLDNISRFLQAQNRAYNIGYTAADLKSRFIGNLLENPGLIGFEADPINEQVPGPITAWPRVSLTRLTGSTATSASLHCRRKLYEGLISGFAKCKAYLRSLFD